MDYGDNSHGSACLPIIPARCQSQSTPERKVGAKVIIKMVIDKLVPNNFSFKNVIYIKNVYPNNKKVGVALLNKFNKMELYEKIYTCISTIDCFRRR